MPITKSAKKAIRESARKRTYNIRKKEKIKILTKQIKKFVSEKKTDEAKKLLPEIYKAIDKATKAKILKKNTANRRKAGIAKSIK